MNRYILIGILFLVATTGVAQEAEVLSEPLSVPPIPPISTVQQPTLQLDKLVMTAFNMVSGICGGLTQQCCGYIGGFFSGFAGIMDFCINTGFACINALLEICVQYSVKCVQCIPAYSFKCCDACIELISSICIDLCKACGDLFTDCGRCLSCVPCVGCAMNWMKLVPCCEPCNVFCCSAPCKCCEMSIGCITDISASICDMCSKQILGICPEIGLGVVDGCETLCTSSCMALCQPCISIPLNCCQITCCTWIEPLCPLCTGMFSDIVTGVLNMAGGAMMTIAISTEDTEVA